jgi:hypothetical protein
MAEIAGSNPTEAMDVSPVFAVSCECRGLRNGLITRSEGSYRLCVCVSMCDLEATKMLRPGPEFGWLHNRRENVMC